MISISERKRFANQGKTLITAIWWAFKASSAIYVSKWFNNIHVNTEKKHCVSLIFLSNEKWTMRWKQMTILSDYHVAVVQSLMPWFIRTLVFLTVKLQLYRDVSWFMVPHRYKTWNFLKLVMIHRPYFRCCNQNFIQTLVTYQLRKALFQKRYNLTSSRI